MIIFKTDHRNCYNKETVKVLSHTGYLSVNSVGYVEAMSKYIL